MCTSVSDLLLCRSMKKNETESEEMHRKQLFCGTQSTSFRIDLWTIKCFVIFFLSFSCIFHSVLLLILFFLRCCIWVFFIADYFFLCLSQLIYTMNIWLL